MPFTIPLKWENGDMQLKPNCYSFLNTIVWLVVFTKLGFQVVQLILTNEVVGINGKILQGIFILGSVGTIVFKATPTKYKVEMVRVINQVAYINSVWGKA